jgi:putative ABC transport system permease protein
MLLLRLIYESFAFATNSLRANKLRTFLSLLGITIGIFAIISVFTVIDSLESRIRESLNELGDDMVFIEKWPWAPPEGETEYPWWRYLNRPIPNLKEAEEIVRRSKLTESAAYFIQFNRTVQFGSDNIENVTILGSSYEIIDTWNLDIDRGRYFSESEMRSGSPVAVIGVEIAEKLFPGTSPIGKTIKIQGHKFKVIGVFVKKGQDMFSTSMDKFVQISAIKSFYLLDAKKIDRGQSICVKAKRGIDSDKFIAELEGIMRNLRRLKPMEDNDFALNEVSVISDGLDEFFKIFNLAGAIIGGFSILVGGFGIANIMFVSVKERTKIIGIQKSLGAKRYFILLQFIFEAIILSIIGGIVGLILIYAGTLIVSYVSDFTIVLTAGNIITGLSISTIIGFIAGFLPARAAARLDPVLAINSV